MKQELGKPAKDFDEIIECMRETVQRKVDEAYQNGKEYGLDEADMREAVSYQKGLNDAWECARKLFSSMADSDIEKAFPIEWNNGGFNALINLQPQEAIAKLKAYEEQKSDDEIKPGDEVVWTEDEDVVIVVTHVCSVNDIEWCDGVCRDGKVYQIITGHARKTGRHFDIPNILEEMKE